MKKWVPSILVLAASLATAYSGQLQHVFGQHPSLAALLLGLAGVILHVLKSPTQPPS